MIKVYAYKETMPYQQGSIVGGPNFLWANNPYQAPEQNECRGYLFSSLNFAEELTE